MPTVTFLRGSDPDAAVAQARRILGNLTETVLERLHQGFRVDVTITPEHLPLGEEDERRPELIVTGGLTAQIKVRCG